MKTPETSEKNSEARVKATKIALKVTLCARVFILKWFLSSALFHFVIVVWDEVAVEKTTQIAGEYMD